MSDQFSFFARLQTEVGGSGNSAEALNPSMINMSTSLLAVKDNFKASMYGAYVFGDPTYLSQLNYSSGTGPVGCHVQFL